MITRMLSLILAVLLVALAAYIFVSTRDVPPASHGHPGATSSPAELDDLILDARESLLSTPHLISLGLFVDIPKKSESENPAHQLITAQGTVDFSEGDAKLVYDFQDLANAAGILGHFDTLNVRYVDGIGYLDIFVSGPPWVSFQPDDVPTDEGRRLRDIMLTTPLILPGVLEAVGESEGGSSGLSTDIDVASLAEASDEFVAGVGASLVELGADQVTVQPTLDGGLVVDVLMVFDYTGASGSFEIEARYGLTPHPGDVAADAPRDSEVRAFRAFFP